MSRNHEWHVEEVLEVAAAAQAMVQARFIMARRFPRSWLDVRRDEARGASMSRNHEWHVEEVLEVAVADHLSREVTSTHLSRKADMSRVSQLDVCVRCGWWRHSEDGRVVRYSRRSISTETLPECRR